MEREKVSSAGVSRECALCGFRTQERILVCPEDGSALITHKPDPLLGTVLGDRFEILALIGCGGMGNVYQARQKVAERYVAVKVLHSERLKSNSSVLRFQQEARAAASLSHPNIIGFFDYGLTEENVPYIVMDYVDGVALDQEIKRGPLDVGRAIGIFMQTCDALEHAHQKGIVHRDIKPSNIMLVNSPDGGEQVKILDFGIAKLLPGHSQSEHPSLTVTGEVFGSPQYMSPEQCSGKAMDARSDMYSLGCVMYETLMGRPPLRGESLIDTITKHTQELPPPFKEICPEREIPEQLEALVMKALEKEPEMRFASMAILKRNLEFVPHFQEAAKHFPKTATIHRFPDERPIKWKRAAAIVGVFVALIVVGAFIAVGFAAGNTEFVSRVKLTWMEFTEGKDNPRLLLPVRELRDSLLKVGRQAEAVTYALEAVSLSEANEPGTAGEAMDLFIAGNLLYVMKDERWQSMLLQGRSKLRLVAQANRNRNNGAANLTGTGSIDYSIAQINNLLGDSDNNEGIADLLNQLQDAQNAGEMAQADQSLEKLLLLKPHMSKEQLEVFNDIVLTLAAENMRRGNASRAESYYKQSVEVTTELYGASSEKLAAVQSDLGVFYLNNGQFTAAETLLLEALAVVNATSGEHSKLAISLLENLGKLYAEMKESRKSQDMLQLARTLKKAE